MNVMTTQQQQGWNTFSACLLGQQNTLTQARGWPEMFSTCTYLLVWRQNASS